MPNLSEVREVLILEPERLCARVIASAVDGVFPHAHVTCEEDPAVAAGILAQRKVDLFVATVRGFDLDTLTLLGVWAQHETANTRVLVVTPEANATALMALRSLPIGGVFDSSTSDMRELEFALRVVASGGIYRSQRSDSLEGPPVRPRDSAVAVKTRERTVDMAAPRRGVPPPNRVRMHLNHRRRLE